MFRLRGYHPLWPAFPDRSATLHQSHVEVPQPRYHRSSIGLGYSAFARRYLRNHYCFLLLGVLRCFSSPSSLYVPMYSVHSDKALPLPGFPIRKSPGQSLFNGSPKLIAVYHVLHRLSLPRHPPYALSSLTIKNRNQSTSFIQLFDYVRALHTQSLPKLTIHMQLSKN